jgi:hypothetical protein
MTNCIPIAWLAAFAIFSVTPAFADRIDGNWCSPNGKTLTIDGANIIIPSGKAITGDYDRHNFRYAGPADDPEEGQDIHMSLQSEQLMYLWRRIGGKDGPVENWRRCQTTS